MIKTRVNENVINLYTSIDEIIYELDDIFNIFDKIIKTYINLYNFKFEMKLIDKNKFFETFYARFNAINILLKFIENFKIFNLTRLILIRL